LKHADVDAAGYRTTLVYDGGNRPYTVQNPLGDITTSLYYNDGLASTTQRTAASGALAATSYLYDNAGRRTGVTNPLNHTTVTNYYPNGRVLPASVKNRLSRWRTGRRLGKLASACARQRRRGIRPRRSHSVDPALPFRPVVTRCRQHRPWVIAAAMS
jgi:YD repeat-containing protein